jgi:hypothetical protein
MTKENPFWPKIRHQPIALHNQIQARYEKKIMIFSLGAGGRDNSTRLKTASCNLQNQNLAPPRPRALYEEDIINQVMSGGDHSQLRNTNGKFVQPNSIVEIIYCTYNWCSALLCQTFYLLIKTNEVWQLRNKYAKYPSTLANSALIILFSEMLKFSKMIFSKSKNIVKDNSEYLGILHLLKWISQN